MGRKHLNYMSFSLLIKKNNTKSTTAVYVSACEYTWSSVSLHPQAGLKS